MKKLLFLSALLAAATAFAATISVTPSPSGLMVGTEEVPLTWTLDIAADGVSATIVDVQPKPFGEYEIPAVFKKGAAVYTVKGIGTGAFANSVGLIAATVPPTVVDIGDYAFSNCTSLAEIKLSYGIRRIGYHPFVNTMIRELELPDSLMDVGGSVGFDGSVGFGLANDLSFVIPEEESHFAVSDDGVLYDKDFRTLIYAPSRLEQLIIPDTVTNIVREALAGCFRLKSVVVPRSVRVIDDRALACVESPYVVPNSGEARTHLKQVVIQSERLDKIGSKVFDGCRELETVYFTGEGIDVAGVAADAFASSGPNDPAAFAVTLSESVASELGVQTGDAWMGRPVTVANQASGGTIIYASQDALGVTWHYRVADGVAEIYNEDAEGNPVAAIRTTTSHNAYHYEYGPDGVTIISSTPYLGVPSMLGGFPVKKVGAHALDGCRAITLLELPDTVTEIGDFAFRDCDGVDAIVLGSRVRSIGRAAFSGTAIAELAIPPSVTRIGGNIGLGCENLVTITAEGSSWFTVQDGLLYDAELEKLYCCPMARTSATLAESVTEIGAEAFGGCARLKKLTLPAGVEEIGAAAFSGCTGLSEIVLPDSVVSVGEDAFSGCTGLKAATLSSPGGIALGDRAFAGCTALKQVTFKGDEPTGGAFDGLYADTPEDLLTVVNASSAVWTVATNSDDVAVWPVAGARRPIQLPGAPVSPDIPVPPAVTGTNVVDGATYESANGDAALIQVEADAEGAFTVPGKIENNDVTGISATAFNNCSNVTSIVIPASVTQIEPGAFNGCASLRSFEVDDANPAYKSVHGALFTRDGKTLVKVPALFTVACEAAAALHDYSRQDQRVPMGGGTWSVLTVRDYRLDETMTVVPAVPMATLLAGVTTVADYAFTDCGYVREGQPLDGTVTVTSNAVRQLTVTANGKQVGTPLTNRASGTRDFSGSVTAPMAAVEEHDVVTNYVQSAASNWIDASGVLHAASATTTFTRLESDRTCSIPLVFPASVKTFTSRAFENSGFTSLPGSTASAPGAGSSSGSRPAGGVAGVPDFSVASVHDGFILRGGVLCGTVQVKAGKMGRTGEVKLAATVQLLGEKKLSLKGVCGPDGAAVLRAARDVRMLALEFGATELAGSFGDGLEVVGARNVFSARGDAQAGAALAKCMKTWKVAFETTSAQGAGAALAGGFGGLSVTVGAKGRAKVAGVLADGTKVGVSAQLQMGADACYVPVLAPLYAGKAGGFGFVLKLPLAGGAEVLGLSEWTAVSRTPFTAELSAIGATAAASEPRGMDVVLEGVLPEGYELDAADPWKGWKPRLTAKTGAFKGTLAVLLRSADGRTKKVKAAVTGVVVDGVGYGSALIKGVASVPLTMQ